MSVNFNNEGTKILALGRRQSVVLYNLHSPVKVFEFDHPGKFEHLLILDCHKNFAQYGIKYGRDLNNKYLNKGNI